VAKNELKRAKENLGAMVPYYTIPREATDCV